MPIYRSDSTRTTGDADFDVTQPGAALRDTSDDAANYWGTNAETFFGITFSRLRSLRDGSATREVALRVRSLTNRRYASAVWLPFAGYNAVPDNFAYFVLTSTEVDALTVAGNADQNNVVLALIRQDNHLNIYIKFKSYRVGGIGGENDGTGIRIPTTPRN